MKKHIFYYDIIRIISCMGIIRLHISSNGWDQFSTTSFAWQSLCAYNTIGALGVALFFMISGALYLDTKKEITPQHMIQKAIHTTIIYYIWLLLYNLKTQGIPTEKESVLYILNQLLQGKGIYHLWFLPTLIGIYLITPLLRDAFSKKENCEYLLTGYIIVVLILPEWYTFNLPGTESLKTITDNFLWTFQVLNYISYFVLGHYLETWPLSESKIKNPRKTAVFLTIAGTTGTILLRGISSAKAGSGVYLSDPLTIIDFIACIGIFSLAKQYITNEPTPKKQKIAVLAKTSFGIYLLHPAILQNLGNWLLSWRMICPIITTPIQICIVTAICSIITYVMLKIPIIQKLFC